MEEENVSHKWYSLNAIRAVDKLSPETTKLTPDEEAERARGYRSLAREKERVDSFAQAADAREEERAGAAAAPAARTPRPSVVPDDKHVYPLPQEEKKEREAPAAAAAAAKMPVSGHDVTITTTTTTT